MNMQYAAIETRDLSKRYEKVEALRGIDLTVTTTFAHNGSGQVTGYETTPTSTTTTTPPQTLTFSEWNQLTNGGTTAVPPGYGNAILIG